MIGAMFRVKHLPGAGKRGSSPGLARASRGLDRPVSARGGPGAVLAAVAVAMMAGGCSAPEELADKAGISATAAATAATATAVADGKVASATATGADGAAFESNAEKNGGSREFAYKWPATVSAIPALAARLTAERDTALAEQVTE